MFGIGFGEFLVIGVLLLIAVGPRRMPVMMKSVGRAMREFRKATRELRAQVGLDELMGEDDVLRPMKKVSRPVRPATSHAASGTTPQRSTASPGATTHNAAPSATTHSAAPGATTHNAAPSAATQNAAAGATTPGATTQSARTTHHSGARESDWSDDPSAEESIDDSDEDGAQDHASARLREYPPDGVDIAESRDVAGRAPRTSGAVTTGASKTSAATTSAATTTAATNEAATNEAATNGSARALGSTPLASAKKAQA